MRGLGVDGRIILKSFVMKYCGVAFNPLNAELNPICHLLVLLGTHHIFHVSGLRVNRDNG